MSVTRLKKQIELVSKNSKTHLEMLHTEIFLDCLKAIWTDDNKFDVLYQVEKVLNNFITPSENKIKLVSKKSKSPVNL